MGSALWEQKKRKVTVLFCRSVFYLWPPSEIRPTLMGTKNLYENGPNPFLLLFFSILWEREWSRFVQPNPFERLVTRLQTDLVTRFVCTSDTKLQTDFTRGATLLLHLADSTARNAAAIAKGMVELRSIVFAQEKSKDAGGKIRGA